MSATAPAIEVRRKKGDRLWTMYSGLDDVARVESPNIELPLGEV